MTKSLRVQTKELEEKKASKIYCEISGMRCVYCPMCMTGTCSHLKHYLKTGSWKKK